MPHLHSKIKSIIYVFLLATTSLHSMNNNTNDNQEILEDQTQEALPQYRFVKAINLPYNNNSHMITFVKKFPDGSLIAFGKRGLWGLFDASYNLICADNRIDGYIHNAYKYKDEHNRELIIVTGEEEMCVTSQRTIWLIHPQEKLFKSQKLYPRFGKKNEFALHQRADSSLFIELCIDRKGRCIILNLFPDWDRPWNSRYEFDKQEYPDSDSDYEFYFDPDATKNIETIDTDNPEDEGVAPSAFYRNYRNRTDGFSLPKDIFDLSSVPEKLYKKLFSFNYAKDQYDKTDMPIISCCHITRDNQIILGHDSRYLVTIWELVEN